MKRPSKIILSYFFGALTVVILVVLIRAIFYFYFPSPVEALPFGAMSIHIERYINEFLPDYEYKLKADIKEAGFQKFVKRIGLLKHYDPERNIYREEDPRYHWSREAYYKDGCLYYIERQT